MELFVLAIGTVATIVIGIVGLVLQKRSNDHFAVQNRIMLNQAPRGSKKDTSGQQAAFKSPRWPLVTMAVMVMLVWAAAAVNYFYISRPFDPNKAWDDNAPLKRIYHQTFINETIPLDGYSYIDSTFDNVTFEYDGTGPVSIDNGHFTSHEW